MCEGKKCQHLIRLQTYVQYLTLTPRKYFASTNSEAEISQYLYQTRLTTTQAKLTLKLNFVIQNRQFFGVIRGYANAHEPDIHMRVFAVPAKPLSYRKQSRMQKRLIKKSHTQRVWLLVYVRSDFEP